MMQKEAFIHIMLLGFLLVSSTVVFVATSADDTIVKGKYFALDKIVYNTTRALSKHYLYNTDMLEAQNVANNILNKTSIGQELLSNNSIQYIWRDLNDDGLPNTITVNISGYQAKTFWYKFLDKDEFTIPPMSASAYVTKDQSQIVSIAIKYGGSDAGYDNMIGTYELDAGGNCINAKLIIANRNSYNVGDNLGSYTNLDTKFFIVPDGYNQFGNQSATIDSPVTISQCANGDIPSVTIDGYTDSTHTYFQDSLFNNDGGYDHMQEVGKTYFDDYLEYVAGEDVCVRWWRSRCVRYEHQTKTWEEWVVYAADNSIDFTNDPNDEYIIAMEDLPNGGDADFNDIKLDTTKIRVPNSVDTVDIEDGTDVSPQ